jgi:arginase family enzyme
MEATMADRDEELTFVGTTNLDRLAELPDDRHREVIERGLDLGLPAADSVQDRTISTFSRGYQPAFAGINTFLKAPYLEDVNQVGGHDVAIVGAPFDMGTTFRPGARWAPQAVRQISKLYDGYNLDMAVDLFEELDIVDVGDVFVIPSNIEKTFDQIDKAVDHIAASGVFPVIIGGDHSIGYPDVRAVARHVDGNVGIVHLDRHIDLAERDMDERMHTTQWFHATRIPNIPSANLVQVGIERAAEAALELASQNTKAIFLSLDIDVVDPGSAPGTGTPEPGGLSSREMLRFISIVAKEAPLAAWKWSRCPHPTTRATSPRCSPAAPSSTCWPSSSPKASSDAEPGEVRTRRTGRRCPGWRARTCDLAAYESVRISSIRWMGWNRQGQRHGVAVGERQRGHVANEQRRLALAAVLRPAGIGSGAGDHGRVQVEAGRLEPVAGQPLRQVAGSAADLEDLCAGGGVRRDVGSDALDEPAEQEPAQGVVDDGIANEDSAWYPVPSGGMAAMSYDGDGCGGGAGQDDELPRSDHHTSPGIQKICWDRSDRVAAVTVRGACAAGSACAARSGSCPGACRWPGSWPPAGAGGRRRREAPATGFSARADRCWTRLPPPPRRPGSRVSACRAAGRWWQRR